MDWWQILLQIASIVFGSVGLWAFVEFLIKRKDDKNEILQSINKSIAELKTQGKKNEKDNCRTQMLLLMSDYPEEKKEIMTLADHYFNDLHGNWYMTALFRNHLKECGIDPPEWFMTAYNRPDKGEDKE